MPARQRSLRITEGYRTRLRGIQARLAGEVERRWQAIDAADLDAYDAPRVAALIEQAQRQSAQASVGYLSAYISSELGRRVSGPTPTVEVGTTKAGRTLLEAATGPLIGVKVAIGEGTDPSEALRTGQAEVLRMASVNADAVARQTLTAGMTADDRIIGWRRTVNGTCGACLGAATGGLAAPDEQIETHPGCLCQPAPEIRGVPDRIKVPTGTQIFTAMSATDQDREFGPDKAELLRSGTVNMADLIDHSPIKNGDDILTERPLQDLPDDRAA